MVLLLRILYIVLFFVVLFIALSKKNFSFLMVYFASSALFYYNAFEGDIFVGKMNQIGVSYYPISSVSYIILIINLIITAFYLFFESEKDNYVIKESQQGERSVIHYFLIAVLLLSLYMCFKYKVFTRVTYNKHQLADESGALATYYKYLASYAFVVAFAQDDDNDRPIWKIIGAFPICSTFLFGNRSYIVISFVAVFFDRVYRRCVRENYNIRTFIRKHKGVVVLVLLLIMVTLVVKGVTYALFTKNFSLVMERLTNPDYYRQVFYVSEPNTIMTNLNTIVINNYQVEKSSYRTLWAYFFPFVTDYIEDLMGAVSFTKIYQRVLYITATNRAATYLGESYANGGIIMVPIIVMLYLIIIVVLFKGYKKCSSNIGKALFLLMGIDGAFYVQRNCMTFQFSRFRDYIYIFVLLGISIAVVRRDHKLRI